MSDKYDWPGWKLDQNHHGKEFDVAARIRMVRGSRKLLPLIERHREGLGNVVMEAGPFFEPLVVPALCPGKRIIYVDNDPYVLESLRQRFPETKAIAHDFNLQDDNLSQKIAEVGDFQVGSVVASHLLNYIDFRRFLETASQLLNRSGLLFINNSIDYGLPAYFSARRPKSNEEILNAMAEMGFKILEWEEILTENAEAQPCHRLLVAGKKQ